MVFGRADSMRRHLEFMVVERNKLMRANIAVAVIDPVGGHAGAHCNYVLALCGSLLAAGCQVSLYTCDQTAVPTTEGLRFQRSYKRIYGDGSRWARAWRYLGGTLAALTCAVARGEKICHLHLFGGAIPELALVLLAKFCWRKVVITVHDVESLGDPAAPSRGTISRVYRFADRLIVHNAFSKRELVEKLGASPHKVSIIPHGNYLEIVKDVPNPSAARRKLGIDESKKVVLFFGQIKDTKGLDLLLRAAPEVARAIPEVTFLIAGRPWKSDVRRHEALIQELGIGDRCVLRTQFIPHGEVARYYNAADVVVLPYRRVYQSGVVLMAMSYKRPVLVSDLPGMTEIVRDEENGFVFAAGSSQQLAERLIEILRNDESRIRVAATGFEYVSREHDWSRIGEMTARVYES
jgi:D-inositol-3-phosphate glycosyltransferase